MNQNRSAVNKLEYRRPDGTNVVPPPGLISYTGPGGVASLAIFAVSAGVIAYGLSPYSVLWLSLLFFPVCLGFAVGLACALSDVLVRRRRSWTGVLGLALNLAGLVTLAIFILQYIRLTSGPQVHVP